MNFATQVKAGPDRCELFGVSDGSIVIESRVLPVTRSIGDLIDRLPVLPAARYSVFGDRGEVDRLEPLYQAGL
jgi:hypothetical protein